MTDIQKAIRDGIRGVSYDMQHTSDPEKHLRMAEAIKTMVEAYEITVKFDLNRVILPKFATGGIVTEKVRFTD